MTELFGMKFVVSAVGLGILDEIAGKVTGLLTNVEELTESVGNLKGSLLGLGRLVAGGALTALPLLLFKSTISAGMELQSIMTQLLVSFNQNQKKAEDTYEQLIKTTEWLPITNEQAMRSYAQLKMAGVDALKPLGEYTTKLGDTTRRIPITLTHLASSLAVQTRRPFEAVIYGLQASMRGAHQVMYNLLGPQAKGIAAAIGRGGEEGFKSLYKYMKDKGILGLAIEQSKTLGSYFIGFRSMISRTLQAIAGMPWDEKGLFRRMSLSLETAYDRLLTFFSQSDKVKAFGNAVSDALMPLVIAIRWVAETGTTLILAAMDAIIAHPFLASVAVWTPVILGMSLIGSLMLTMVALLKVFVSFVFYQTIFAKVWGMITGMFPALLAVLPKIVMFFKTLAGGALLLVGVLWGLWDVFNAKAFMSGFMDGFKLVWGIVMQVAGALSYVSGRFSEMMSDITNFANKVAALMGISADMYDFWQGLGILIGGVVAAAFGTLYVVAKAVLVVFKGIFMILTLIVQTVRAATSAFATGLMMLTSPFRGGSLTETRVLPEAPVKTTQEMRTMAQQQLTGGRAQIGQVNITVPITGNGVTSQEVENFAYGLQRESSEIFGGQMAMGMGGL